MIRSKSSGATYIVSNTKFLFRTVRMVAAIVVLSLASVAGARAQSPGLKADHGSLGANVGAGKADRGSLGADVGAGKGTAAALSEVPLYEHEGNQPNRHDRDKTCSGCSAEVSGRDTLGPILEHKTEYLVRDEKLQVELCNSDGEKCKEMKEVDYGLAGEFVQMRESLHFDHLGKLPRCGAKLSWPNQKLYSSPFDLLDPGSDSPPCPDGERD